jgi:large subunit ribosomal protein L14e
MLFNVGRVCIKLAGRDAGKYCVIVEELDDHFVLIDGQTRRRKCNVLHLDPTDKLVDLKSGASFNDVKSALESVNILVDDKASSRKSSDRPKKQKKVINPKSKK